MAGGLRRAFLSSSLGTGLSRLLGLVREMAIAGALGAGVASDAFTTAFTIPGVFRRFVADEGLTGALIPEVAAAEAQDGVEEARRLAGRALTALLLVGALLCAVAIPAAPWLVRLFAEGFERDPEKFALTVQLTRWMVPFVVTVSVVSWAEGLLNHRDHFFTPKVAPGLVSAAMVVAALWPTEGGPEAVVQSLAYGVLVGGVLHVLVCLPPLVRAWGVIRPRFDLFADNRFRHLLSEMGKVAFIGLTAQANIIILRRVASYLQDGAPTWYWNAARLVDFSQGIIAVGVGSALMPAVARAVAQQDWPGFRSAFVGSARLVAALLLPAATFVGLLAEPMVAVLFRHGHYTAFDVTQTAKALVVLVPYMVALASIQILKKPFFALGQRTPLMLVAVLGVALTGGLGAWWGPQFGVVGLAATLSVSTVVQMVLYVVLLRQRAGAYLGLSAIAGSLGRTALACVPAGLLGVGLATFGDWSQGPTVVNVALLATIGVLGGAAYGVSAYALGVREVVQILQTLRKKVGR